MKVKHYGGNMCFCHISKFVSIHKFIFVMTLYVSIGNPLQSESTYIKCTLFLNRHNTSIWKRYVQKYDTLFKLRYTNHPSVVCVMNQIHISPNRVDIDRKFHSYENKMTIISSILLSVHITILVSPFYFKTNFLVVFFSSYIYIKYCSLDVISQPINERLVRSNLRF